MARKTRRSETANGDEGGGEAALKRVALIVTTTAGLPG